jgi:hypothetical protein
MILHEIYFDGLGGGAVAQNVRQAGPQAHADRERRIPSRAPPRACQRVKVDAKEARIMGSKSVLLRALVAASSAKTAGFGVPEFCTEMAHPTRFERVTCSFGAR